LADACKTQERALLFKNHYTHCFNRFANEHVLDTYVFCLSNHSPDDNDGRLSMWRGYGANGNRLDIQASVNLAGLKKPKDMLTKYESILEMMAEDSGKGLGSDE
jgi:hypothetical protein